MPPAAAMPDRRPPVQAKARQALLIACVAAAFVIYAVAVLILHQKQKDDFVQERSSIAAAVSNIYYGATLGSVHVGILDRMLDFDIPLEKTLAQAAKREIPPKGLLTTIYDGNGIGYIVVTTLSFRLLGPHTQSMVIVMLALLAISAGAFLHRFRDQRAAVVLLYITSLIVMLYTPLVWHRPYELNMSIGAIRYFALIATLPAFHLLLEIADTRTTLQWTDWRKMLPLALQIPILILAVLVRNSAAPVIGAVMAGCLFLAWRWRRNFIERSRLLHKAIAMSAVAILFVGLLMLTVSSSYVREGKFTEVVWHRIFLSIGTNPSWPFPGVRELYDCTRYIPEGMDHAMTDRNSHCVLWVYAMKHNIPPEIASTWTHGREHEKALREAFFDIAYRYPLETLSAFVVYKPRYIVWSVWRDFEFKLFGIPPALPWLFAAALANLLLFSVAGPSLAASTALKSMAGITVLLSVFGALPHMLVWALPHTCGELVLYTFFAIGFAAVTAIQKTRDLASPAPKSG